MTPRLATKFQPGQLNVYETPKDIGEVTRALRHTGRRVMLVPTMGALHDGHRALVKAARRVPGSVERASLPGPTARPEGRHAESAGTERCPSKGSP